MPLLALGCILLGLIGLLAQPHESGIAIALPIFILITGFIVYYRFSPRHPLLPSDHKERPRPHHDNDGFTDYSSGLAAGYIPLDRG